MTAVASPRTALNWTNSVPESSRNVHHSVSSWSRSQAASVGSEPVGQPGIPRVTRLAGMTGSIVTSRRTPSRPTTVNGVGPARSITPSPARSSLTRRYSVLNASRFDGLSRGASGSTSASTSSIGRPPIASTRAPTRSSYGAPSGGDDEALGKAPPADRVQVGAVVRRERPDAAVAVAPVPGRHRGEADELDQPLVVGQRCRPGRRPRRRPRSTRRDPCRTSRRGGWCRGPRSMASTSAWNPPAVVAPAVADAVCDAASGRRGGRCRIGPHAGPNGNAITTRTILPVGSFLRASTHRQLLHRWRQAVWSAESADRRSRATVAARPIARRTARASSSSIARAPDEPCVGLAECGAGGRVGSAGPASVSTIRYERRSVGRQGALGMAALEHRAHEMRHRGRRHARPPGQLGRSVGPLVEQDAVDRVLLGRQRRNRPSPRGPAHRRTRRRVQLEEQGKARSRLASHERDTTTW